jgi:competence protein ComEA
MTETTPTPKPPVGADRLVERWLPGGRSGVETARAWANRHRTGVAIAVIALLVAIGMTVVLAATRPQPVEAAPALPPAISAAATTTQAPLVISVVGKVANPGLVTLTTGARVADAIRAAGGLLPGTDDEALNLARRLTDGEQIYVGIPVPSDADQQATTDTPAVTPAGKKGMKSAETTTQVDLNTATIDQLQTLPGIGPTMAQRILTWRTQHGHFDSINQLRDVGGIGDARFAKLAKLVTT